jgi:hypothetical protein
MLKYFLNVLKKKFCPQKVEKNTLKSCSEKLKSTFFPLLPAQPKWPKQKNSCSKMWPIDQLYIELGIYQNVQEIFVSCNVCANFFNYCNSLANFWWWDYFHISILNAHHIVRNWKWVGKNWAIFNSTSQGF